MGDVAITLKEKARTWWAAHRARLEFLAVLCSCFVLGAVVAAVVKLGQPAAPSFDQLAALSKRIDALERAAAPQPADQPAPEPDPQPPRASAPRAALRPGQPTATAALPEVVPQSEPISRESVDTYRASLRTNLE